MRENSAIRLICFHSVSALTTAGKNMTNLHGSFKLVFHLSLKKCSKWLLVWCKDIYGAIRQTQKRSDRNGSPRNTSLNILFKKKELSPCLSRTLHFYRNYCTGFVYLYFYQRSAEHSTAVTAACGRVAELSIIGDCRCTSFGFHSN